MNKQISVYKRHRFPDAVISRAVWLYHRFSLSFREVEEFLAARGVVVSYETIRQWCFKFPSGYAKKQRFKSTRQAQQFLSFHGVLNNLFRQQRHLMSAKNFRALRVIDIWSFVSYPELGWLATDRCNAVFVC